MFALSFRSSRQVYLASTHHLCRSVFRSQEMTPEPGDRYYWLTCLHNSKPAPGKVEQRLLEDRPPRRSLPRVGLNSIPDERIPVISATGTSGLGHEHRRLGESG